MAETFNLANIYSAAEQVKGMRSRNELLDQRRAEEDAVRSASQAAVDPQTGELDVQRLTGELARQGFVDRAQQIRSGYIERLSKGAQFLNSMLPYVNEASYPKLKAQLEQSGMAAPGMLPDQLNPEDFARGVALLNGKLAATQKWGPLEQLEGAPEGTLGQRELTTGEVAVRTRPALGGLAPSSTREWEYYNSLSPEDQQRYIEMKRSNERIVDVNSVPTRVTSGPQGSATPLSTLPAEASAAAAIEAAKTTAKERATADAKAVESLPQQQAKATQMLSLLTQLEQHPGLPGSIGARAGLAGVPGTPQADFIALLDQIGGQQFLQAFESLKGGGQITEVEGRKATDAIARLQNRNQSEQAYRQAIADFRSVIQAGLERAQQRAAAAGTGAAVPTPPAQSQAEPTATGPNGEKVVFRNGQWVPLQ